MRLKRLRIFSADAIGPASGCALIGGLIIATASTAGGSVASSPQIKDALGVTAAAAGAVAAVGFSAGIAVILCRN